MLKSVKSYGDHDFSTSLIFSWTVSEKLVSILWNRLVESKRIRKENDQVIVFINDQRKKRLQGRDFPVSNRIEILSLLNIIPLELYKRLNSIRIKRNDWVHNLGEVDDASASLAIQVAQEMFAEISKVKFSLTISHAIEY